MIGHVTSILATINYEIILRALLGRISECGDIGIIKEYDNQCFFALIDVLGHGSEARKLALLAEDYLINHYRDDLIVIMNGLHVELTGTRGAVAAICRLDIITGELSYVGIGNITVRILGLKAIRLVAKDGIIGYQTIRPQAQSLKLSPGDILLLHSDGINEYFDVYECAGLLSKSAEGIAKGIMNKFSKNNDDASCMVLKYRR